MANIFRLARIWTKNNRVLQLQGVMKPNQAVARSPTDKIATLATFWAPVFNAPPAPLKAIKLFVRQFVAPWPDIVIPCP